MSEISGGYPAIPSENEISGGYPTCPNSSRNVRFYFGSYRSGLL